MDSRNPEMHSRNPGMHSKNPEMNSRNPEMHLKSPKESVTHFPINEGDLRISTHQASSPTPLSMEFDLVTRAKNQVARLLTI